MMTTREIKHRIINTLTAGYFVEDNVRLNWSDTHGFYIRKQSEAAKLISEVEAERLIENSLKD